MSTGSSTSIVPKGEKKKIPLREKGSINSAAHDSFDTRDETRPSPSAVHFATRFIFVSPYPLPPLPFSFGKSWKDVCIYIYIFHQGRQGGGGRGIPRKRGASGRARSSVKKGGNGGHRVYKSNRARPLNSRCPTAPIGFYRMRWIRARLRAGKWQ